MSENKLAGLVYLLIALVCANLAISTYLLLRPAGGAAAEKTFPESQTRPIAQKMVALYNQKNAAQMYQMFDELVRVQLAEQTLVDQLDRLHSLLGSIEDHAYSHTQFASTQQGRDLYNVFYKARLKGGSIVTGELKLVVYEKKGELALVGFFLHGQDDGRAVR
jgi:hypothetical protein